MTEQTPDLLPLLRKIATENNIKNAEIKITPVSTGGANYSSYLYLADITTSDDKDNELRLFIKVAAMGENVRGQMDLPLYDIERYFYTNLLKTYRELEKRHGISQEQQMKFPKYYGADDTYLHEIIVLENIACQGYILNDRTKTVDWEYAKAAITELAKFHALSMCFEREHPQEFQEISQRSKYKLFNEETDEVMRPIIMDKALNAVHADNKQKLKKFTEIHTMLSFNEYFVTRRRAVLCHGDFRPSNMMYRIRHDGGVDVTVVDYQTISYGSPVIDLLYFIFADTDGPTRAQYYQKLVKHYHQELGRALARLGLDVEEEYSAKEYELELQEKLPYGLLVAILITPICTMPEEDTRELGSEQHPISALANIKTGGEYEKRINEVVDEYVAWEILK